MIPFVLRGLVWSLGLFGLIRFGWFETLAVLPLTRLQTLLARGLFGPPVSPIDVTLACSGADALAFCIGAILAYPALWPVRLGGASLGALMILGLNTLRIGTLGRAAGSRLWFEALHVYVWPAVLALAIATYVFAWMRFANRQPARLLTAETGVSHREPAPGRLTPQMRRFVWLSGSLMALFIATSPLYIESTLVLALAVSIAQAAASILGALGIAATATANVLNTTRGGFMVTQECIVTPLIPVYLAAVLASSTSWSRRLVALLAALPLFAGLGVARLLVVALPAALVESPLLLVHSFYQLLLAGVLVAFAARWRHGEGGRAGQRALIALGLGGAFMYLLGSGYARVLSRASGGGSILADPQGALALLPAFQAGLYVALAVAGFTALNWRPFLAGLALLGVSHVALFGALHFAMNHTGLTPHVRDVRAWALAGPLLVCGLLTWWPGRVPSAGRAQASRSRSNPTIRAHELQSH